MRSSLVIGFVVAAAVAAGCKKDKKDPPKKPPVVVVDAGTGATVPPGKTLKMTEVPPKVGDKQAKTDDVVVNFEFDVQGQKVKVESVQHKQEAQEILAVQGTMPVKIKVAYSGLSSKQTAAGKVKEKPQILDGKTYVVWAEGGMIKATTEAGAVVSGPELDALASENDTLGKPDVMQEILGNREWKIGEPYVFTDLDLAKLALRSSPEKPKPTGFSLTLQSFDDKGAVFALTATLEQAKADDKLTFTMKGEARVELPSTRPIGMTMDGTLAGKANGMPASGVMKATTAYTY